MDTQKRPAIYDVADFISENWEDTITIVAIGLIIYVTVMVETQTESLAVIVKLIEMLVGILTVLAIRMMLFGRQIRARAKLVSIGKLLQTHLEWDGDLFQNADSITIVGRSLGRTLESNFQYLSQAQRNDCDITIVVVNPDNPENLQQLHAIYGGVFTAEQHQRRINGMLSTATGLFQALPESANKRRIILLDHIPTVGGVVIRKPHGHGCVGLEIYSDDTNTAFWVYENQDPLFFAQLAKVVEDQALHGTEMSIN